MYHASAYFYAPWRWVFPVNHPHRLPTTEMLCHADNPAMPILHHGSAVLIRCLEPTKHSKRAPAKKGVWVPCVVPSLRSATMTLDWRITDSRRGKETAYPQTLPMRHDVWGAPVDAVQFKPSHNLAAPNQLFAFRNGHFDGSGPRQFKYGNKQCVLVGPYTALSQWPHFHGSLAWMSAITPCVVAPNAPRFTIDQDLADVQYTYKLAALFNRS